MTVFGFLAVVVFCVALILCRILEIKYGIKHIEIYRDETIKEPEKPATSIPGFSEQPKVDEEEINKTFIKSSMDSVIKAANELMGIATEEDTNDARKE